ncbi:hypothetical protein DBR32_03580 [Taibaiella sp. KBW10]|uniref:c-type cytochrome n=1 Tax=Taibaiella sp. KBW10 TaxID=2153357 RepID=UPI000F5AA4A3|nr:cytochrome c [Taibaiella sp. KBW10]RQO31898.1 hypothetical protein DBR32_03580 [Taibaiella sp. KBW10]
MKNLFWSFGAVAVIAVAFASCSKDNEYDLANNNNVICDTTAVSYANTVAAIMSANCNVCHSGANPSAGIATNTYQGLNAFYSVTLLGSIRHEANYSPMPNNAPKLSDCDINKVTAWINQGKLNN